MSIKILCEIIARLNMSDYEINKLIEISIKGNNLQYAIEILEITVVFLLFQ
jgi:hypothetical protein